MLEVKNASLQMDGTTLFSGLSFTVDDGQILCITGGSGAGKTTLLRALLGFWPLSEGHISIDGELLTPSSAEDFRKSMAYVPQEPALPSELVSEMVSMLFQLKVNRGMPFSKSRLMAEWERLGLAEELYDKKVMELSGGQRQRIMLSVCGLLDKPIVLADEPTSALDHQSAILVMEYFRRMADKGCTVVAVSHDEAFAAGCDNIVEI